MPYAEGRVYNDADAHIMEPANWVTSYADTKTRALLKPMDLSKAGKMADHATLGRFDPSHWDEVDIEKNLMFIKGWEALGAFDSGRAQTRAGSDGLQPPARLHLARHGPVLGGVRTARA